MLVVDGVLLLDKPQIGRGNVEGERVLEITEAANLIEHVALGLREVLCRDLGPGAAEQWLRETEANG